MRRGVVVILLILFLAALPTLAQDTSLAPGEIRVTGSTDEFDQFNLDVTVAQAGADLFPIQAVKIYSEPSHTLLFAQVDDASPVFVLTAVQGEKPESMVTRPIGGGTVRARIPAPPAGDARIRVDYVGLAGSRGRSVTIAEGSVSSLANFDFSVEPLIGKYKLCGYCSGLYCGCIFCPTPLFTVCCSNCSLYCGIVTCPG